MIVVCVIIFVYFVFCMHKSHNWVDHHLLYCSWTSCNSEQNQEIVEHQEKNNQIVDRYSVWFLFCIILIWQIINDDEK
jgi:hypothetical protein